MPNDKKAALNVLSATARSFLEPIYDALEITEPENFSVSEPHPFIWDEDSTWKTTWCICEAEQADPVHTLRPLYRHKATEPKS